MIRNFILAKKVVENDDEEDGKIKKVHHFSMFQDYKLYLFLCFSLNKTLTCF